MWYFAWILGLALAFAFAVLNGIWYEVHASNEGSRLLPDTEVPDELS